MTIRRPLSEREVRARIIVIEHVRVDHLLELILVDRDYVVGAFAPKSSNDAFAVSVLPRRASGTDDLIKFEGIDAS